LPTDDEAYRFLIAKKSIIEIIKHYPPGPPIVPLFFKLTGLSNLQYRAVQFILTSLSAASLLVIFLIFFKILKKIIPSILSTILCELNIHICLNSINTNMYGLLIFVSLLFLYYLLYCEPKIRYISLFYILLFYIHYTTIIIFPLVLFYSIYLVYTKKEKITELLLFVLLIPGIYNIVILNNIVRKSDYYFMFYKKTLFSIDAFQISLRVLVKILRHSIFDSFLLHTRLFFISFIFLFLLVILILVLKKIRTHIALKRLGIIVLLLFLNICGFQFFTKNNLQIRFVIYLYVFINIYWILNLFYLKKLYRNIFLIIFFSVYYSNIYFSSMYNEKHSFQPKLSYYYDISKYAENNKIDFIGHLSPYTYLRFDSMGHHTNLLLSNHHDVWHFHSDVIDSSKKFFSNYAIKLKNKKIVVLYYDYRKNDYFEKKLDEQLTKECIYKKNISNELIEYHF